MTTVAVAQFAPGEDKAANLEAVTGYVTEAAAQGADLVVFPEYSMFTAPAMDERFLASAESLDGPFVSALQETARQQAVTIVAGINETTDRADQIHNTLVAIDGGGKVTAAYRKMHLYDAFGYSESRFVRAGVVDAPETFTVGGLTFGMQTCYDLRFPEATRRLVDAGADVVLIPAEWVPGPLKENHWTTLIRARAIENTIYVAAADQCGAHGAGNSMIVDPMGVVLSSLGEEAGMVSATLNPERIERVREKNPALALRRFAVVER
ncbi:carbon-nitrogen hydrolase family protein [Mycolicibacterium sp. 018/SC-01/001]|uniref:carbon-nitrogen hydrolase family protein n=1 Tax=Mycolicibacterium sp. 018/SC-01/001 TaxID=2592069 RepID=UPI001180B8BF|nr:carbon-nitrogen hydrolase family protein [Mycolicibacterium sp. 018/SC-01/001]TRW80063.1 carbon-nitrogen hydrolase family protein [Mycolicibacterium sp. 018/SC-01/001]